MSLDDTGIGLLVFDRPEHTKQVLSGLKRNKIDHLYVFADGPKPDSDKKAIKRTRDLIKNIEFCEVDAIFRTENLGLKRSWIRGYNYIFDRHKRAIMLEDDCVPSGDFIAFMRACLNKYDDDHRVMNIHGYSPPIEIPGSYPYDVFFTWRAGSHGQATWKSAWEEFNQDPKLLEMIQNDKNFRNKVERAGPDLRSMLKRDIDGEIDSVQVWWSLSLVRNNGVSVNPVESRINNIGHDGSGMHSNSTDRYDVDIDYDADFDGLSLPPDVEVNSTIHSSYLEYMLGSDRSQVQRAIDIYSEAGVIELLKRVTKQLFSNSKN